MRNVGFGKIIAYGQNVEKRDLPVKRDGGYGQNVENWDLPVKRDGRLRAKHGKLRFARKMRRAVTGKTRKTEICP